MRAKQRIFAATIVFLAALSLACASSDKNASDDCEVQAAGPMPVPATGPPTCFAQTDDRGQETNGAAHVDPVPDALERMKRWPGLGDAVTRVVMTSPKGRIHGHDAERIDIDVDEKSGKAKVVFVLPASFELHGDRRLACINEDGGWRCTDET